MLFRVSDLCSAIVEPLQNFHIALRYIAGHCSSTCPATGEFRDGIYPGKDVPSDRQVGKSCFGGRWFRDRAQGNVMMCTIL
jgi:hypothetical protein